MRLIILLITIAFGCSKNIRKDIQKFEYKDNFITVNRECKMVDDGKIRVSLNVVGLNNNCSECPFFMTDTFSRGVKALQDTACIYKVKLPRDNEVGFTILPPVADTIKLSYFIEKRGIENVVIDGDIAYHPKRVLTLLQTDCTVK